MRSLVVLFIARQDLVSCIMPALHLRNNLFNLHDVNSNYENAALSLPTAIFTVSSM
jgi:hypothetical protein